MAFERVVDFERYPLFSDAVIDVAVRQESETRLTSDWKVHFRNGILCWSERDTIDPNGLKITFEQTEGDFHQFTGGWTVDRHSEGCVLQFMAEFDLGIPSLAYMLDPIAENALRENIERIVSGLFSNRVETSASAVDLTAG
jgi:ribosome-associated toxin RatA of RatAB toxin-antitoxin module